MQVHNKKPAKRGSRRGIEDKLFLYEQKQRSDSEKRLALLPKVFHPSGPVATCSDGYWFHPMIDIHSLECAGRWVNGPRTNEIWLLDERWRPYRRVPATRAKPVVLEREVA